MTRILPGDILAPLLDQARQHSREDAFRAGFAEARCEDFGIREAIYRDALHLADALLETAADLFAGRNELFDLRRQETSAAIKRALAPSPHAAVRTNEQWPE